MSESSKAVFLSYTSQDAEAVWAKVVQWSVRLYLANGRTIC